MSKEFTYKNNAESYNKVEDIPGEKEMLIECAGIILNYLKNIKRKISILDLCCGTELIFDHLDNRVKENISLWIGVDISASYLVDARKRIGNDKRFVLIKHDAVPYKAKRKFDVIIASSAYHHIEDERKVKFLRNIYQHLRDNGIIIFLENILPKYSSDVERSSAAVEFYARRIIDCIDNHGIKDERIALLSRVMQYERDRDYEWKSHHNLFMKHLKQANLKVISVKKVWPLIKMFDDEKVGDFVFVVRKK